MDYLEPCINYFKTLSVSEIIQLATPVFTMIGVFFTYLYKVVRKASTHLFNKKSRLLKYYNEYADLPEDNSSDLTKSFILREIKGTIESRITKIKNSYFRKLYIFIVLNARNNIDTYTLKRVIELVKIDGFMKIDIQELKVRNRKSILLVFVFTFIMFAFLFLGVLINIYPTESLMKNILLENYFFCLTIVSELFLLYYFNSYNRIKPVEKLNNALAEIDASAFKPN